MGTRFFFQQDRNTPPLECLKWPIQALKKRVLTCMTQVGGREEHGRMWSCAASCRTKLYNKTTIMRKQRMTKIVRVCVCLLCVYALNGGVRQNDGVWSIRKSKFGNMITPPP